jgi:hypothetical protein
MLTNNSSQATPNTIAHDRASETTRSDEPCAHGTRILYREDIEHQQFTPARDSAGSYAIKF